MFVYKKDSPDSGLSDNKYPYLRSYLKLNFIGHGLGFSALGAWGGNLSSSSKPEGWRSMLIFGGPVRFGLGRRIC